MPDAYLNRLMSENETIQLITRQHWFVFVRNIFVEGISILAIAILVIIAQSQWGQQYTWISWFAILLLFPIISALLDFLHWYNRKYVVTNRRVIQLEGVINKNVIDSSLEKINDVKLTQSIFGRIFNFGDVEILTASELGVNLFRRIGDPIRFKTIMLNAKERAEHEMMTMAPSTGTQNRDIPGMISQLDNLRKQGLLTDQEFAEKKAKLLQQM